MNDYLISELKKLIIEDSLIFLVCLVVVINIFKYSNKNKKSTNKRILAKVFLSSFALLCMYNILLIQSGTNRLNYSIAIVKDIIFKETTVSNISSIITRESWNTLTHRNYHSASISYKENGNTHWYYSKETNDLVEIVDKLEKLEDEITIEYYSNSKIIKSIDGINKDDHEKLEERIKNLQEQKEIEELNIRTDGYEIKQEEKEPEEIKWRAIQYEIKKNSIGKNIEDVKKDLEENGLLNCPIKYISTKLYSIGTIAFVERNEERSFGYTICSKR